MVGVKFNGRLGNQLFQLFFLLYLKSRSKGKFYFFVNPHHAYLCKYFDLGLYYNLTLSSKIYSIFTRLLPYLLNFKSIYIQNIQVPREVQFEDYTIYTGFFQTDWYMNHTPENFKIHIRKKYIEAFQKLYGDVFKNQKTIAVHIRRTDYLNYGKRDISLPIEYFKKRLNSITNLESYKVFFLSDDISYVKSTFPEQPNFIFSENNEIIDFQIVQNADIAIISNSSFSWWAAYLGKKDSLVMAPKNWLGFRLNKEHPKGVMTSRFTWHEVFET